MMIKSLDHVAVVVDDLEAATTFFIDIGLVLLDSGPVQGHWVDGHLEGRRFEGETVDSIVGLSGVRAEIVHLEVPGGRGKIELTKYHAPTDDGADTGAPSHRRGLRHICFDVEDIDTLIASLRAKRTEFVGEFVQGQDSRLAYVRGPEGIIIELAEDLPPLP